MEAIILIILIAVVGYFVYQFLPNTKFKKAQTLFNAKNYIQAANILIQIFDKHISAPAKLAECKLRLGQQSSDKEEKIKHFNEVTALRDRIGNSASISKFEVIEAKINFEIAKIQYEQTQGDVNKLSQNVRFIDSANKKDSETDFATLKTKHLHDLAAICFKNAIEKEKTGKYSDAAQAYITSKEYADISGSRTIYWNALVREEICKLKQSSLSQVIMYKKSIGIFLGERKSAVAFGDKKIIRNKENEEFTPNYISIRNDKFVVGSRAHSLLKVNPRNTIFSVRKLIGKNYYDRDIQQMINSPDYKYRLTSLKGESDDSVAVILGGKKYTPEQLSAEILKKLKRDAEEKLGDKVTHAVITIPACFTEKQRNATRIAAQLAGLKVQKLLAEPTAAAIAYGVDNLKAGDAKTVLIYDFGGGTFDLSILNIVDGQYMEAGTRGDRWLGGDDLDKALQTHILHRIAQEYNIENIDALIENLDQRKRFQFDAQFRNNLEDIKIQLNSSMNAQLIMDGFEDENGEWVDFDLTITREEFEKLAKPFVERSIELIDVLLKEVGYDISMVDNILLVGGTSCIPLVKQMLSQKYGSDKIKVSEKPMLAVVEGAGILSHRLGDEYEQPIDGDGLDNFNLIGNISNIKPYNISKETLSLVPNADATIRNDFYYRYSIQLLKNKKFSDAKTIMSSHLAFQSSDIDKLNEILKAEINNNALKRIEEINTSIEQLHNNSLSTEELEILYNNLDKTIIEINIIDKPLSERIADIKPTLFNRLLSHYISAEQYINSVTIIRKYPKFWESPELLKNLGICCYGIASKGLLNEENYQIIIAGWLTSVYSDGVVLKSLEETTWDDKYTFTLLEAIGSNYTQHKELPDNVNYDELSASNISIGATQKELLQQFETIIHNDIQEANLSKLVNDFYDKEKEALENIIEIIENKIHFATPYFATTFDINNEIIAQLDDDYQNWGNENSLEAGLPFIKNSRYTIVYQYFYADDLIDRVVNAIRNENCAIIEKLNTQENKNWIDKFHNIKNSQEDNLFNSIARKIDENDENENLITIMEKCISFSDQNEKLKYQYSNYVANYCISKVNAKQISNCQALILMKGAYSQTPDIPIICKNFIILIVFNILDMIHNRTIDHTKIYRILDWVKSNMSHTYKQNCNEINKARIELIQQLKDSGVDTSLLDVNNPLSGQPLKSGQTLEVQGLILKRQLTYLKDLGHE